MSSDINEHYKTKVNCKFKQEAQGPKRSPEIICIALCWKIARAILPCWQFFNLWKEQSINKIGGIYNFVVFLPLYWQSSWHYYKKNKKQGHSCKEPMTEWATWRSYNYIINHYLQWTCLHIFSNFDVCTGVEAVLKRCWKNLPFWFLLDPVTLKLCRNNHCIIPYNF